jgi:hypothetical protein
LGGLTDTELRFGFCYVVRIYIMASITIPGNDGPLTIENLPLNKVERASAAADTYVAAGLSNTAVIGKMSKYQTEAQVDVPAAVTKTVKAKAPKAVAPAAPSKTKRAKGANNAKRARALEMFKDMTAQGLSQEKMLKAVQDELKITYANTYYYYSRVFKKA